MMQTVHMAGRYRALALHLLRGLVGIACVVAAIRIGRHQGGGAGAGLTALLLVGTAMVAFRGCPMCWTMGLIEKVVRRA